MCNQSQWASNYFIDDVNFEGYLKYTSSGDNRLRLQINKFFKNVDDDDFLDLHVARV